MRIVKIFFGIALITICFNGYTQYKKNAVVLEILGKSPPVNVCYQRYFSKRFNAGTGIGMAIEGYTKLQVGNFYRKRLNFNAPIYIGYSVGKRKSQLSSEVGITYLLRWYDYKLLSGKSKKLELLDSMPFISLGYVYKGEKYFFNIPVYLLKVKVEYYYDERYDRPDHIIMPMIGIRIGRLF